MGDILTSCALVNDSICLGLDRLADAVACAAVPTAVVGWKGWPRPGDAAWQKARNGEVAAQADLLRDLFGPLPFRPIAVAPALLRWHDGTVVRLAQAAYEARLLPAGQLDPIRLAVLADALEEAECDDRDILGHLREPGAVHVRGCWAVDCLTVRE
jgi:hypothetical protein